MSNTRRRSTRTPFIRLALLVFAVGALIWSRQRPEITERAPTASSPTSTAEPSAALPPTIGAGTYDTLERCRLEAHRHNDGDSFHVRHGDQVFELRLYFVDAPEKYLSDRYENQRRRVADQAEDLGGLDLDQTIALGQEAREQTGQWLQAEPFTVHTRWERVYDSDRVYGFVEFTDGDFLSERLISAGLARLHTKGETMPDGRSRQQFESHLRGLEREARQAKRGAWGL